MKNFDGYLKKKLGNTYVLLSGGGLKSLGDFIGSLLWDNDNKKLKYKSASASDWSDLVTFGANAFKSTAYLPLSGGTLSNSNNILNIKSSSANSWIYFLSTISDTSANRASVGYYSGLAFLANEKGYQRIGVNDSGTPQYWDNSTGGSGHVFNLIHSGNISSQNVAGARYISCFDTRSTMPAPTEYTATTTGVSFDFKQNSVTGLPGYTGVMTYRPYSSSGDWTGGAAHQLGFCGGDNRLYHRTGTSSWSSTWYKIAYTSDLNSYLPLSGGTMTGLIYFNLYSLDTTYIGHANADWMHFLSPVPFYFSTNVSVNGNITQYSTGYSWIHTGNIGSQSVNYANSSNSANYLPTLYIGGDRPNPQTYFSSSIGLRVAMTRYADIGMGTAWHDTLWINGYSGSDVPYMCALHFKRNGEPRFAISSQHDGGTGYGTMYEAITTYNIGSQSVNYANSAGYIPGQLCINGGSNEGTYGISLYRSGYDYMYGIKFTQTSNWGTCSYSSFGVTGDWATYFTMDNSAHRGWIFRTYGVGNVASISNDGHLTLVSSGITLCIGSLNSSWVHFENNAAVNYYFDHSVYADGQFYLYSDKNLKEKIRNINERSLMNLFNVSNKLLKSFVWKKSKKHSYGFIAQDLQKWIPEAVSEGPEYKSVDYNVAYAKIIAALVYKTKEQQKEINNLKDLLSKIVSIIGKEAI